MRTTDGWRYWTILWCTRLVWCPSTKEAGQSGSQTAGYRTRYCVHQTHLVRSQTGTFLGFHMKKPMDPWPLEAIKGTPRRLQPAPKHFKSIPTLGHATTDFSVILTRVLCCFCDLVFLRSFLCHSCVCCCIVLLCVYSISIPYSKLWLRSFCKVVWDFKLWRFLTNKNIDIRKK
jgi:hypothetical protein